MLLSNTVLLAIGGALVAAILLVALTRGRAKQDHTSTRPASKGPADMQFVCAGCAQQFAHTKRTIAAWGKGTRRLFCNACHQKWRGSRPPVEHQSVPVSSARASSPGGAFARSSDRARHSTEESSSSRGRVRHAAEEPRSGCLGVIVLLVVLPIILFVGSYS